MDLDTTGVNITRRTSAEVSACLSECDRAANDNTEWGRITCFHEGRPVRTYPRTGRQRGNCQLLTEDGRNIQTFDAKSLAACREALCTNSKWFLPQPGLRRWTYVCLYRGEPFLPKSNLPL